MDVNETIKSREHANGNFADNCHTIQALKTIMNTRSNKFTAVQQHGLDMICQKLGRISSGDANEKDHWHDIAGYATLVEQDISCNKHLTSPVPSDNSISF